jgi:hypothetical protein
MTSVSVDGSVLTGTSGSTTPTSGSTTSMLTSPPESAAGGGATVSGTGASGVSVTPPTSATTSAGTPK